MRWVPEACHRRQALVFVLGQLGRKTTIVAIINAVILLLGAHLDPGKLDAIGLLLSVADSIVLALLQEGPPPPPPPPAEGCSP